MSILQLADVQLPIPNMNAFGDWLTRTKVIIVFDSFCRKLISIVFHYCNQPITKPVYICGWWLDFSRFLFLESIELNKRRNPTVLWFHKSSVVLPSCRRRAAREKTSPNWKNRELHRWRRKLMCRRHRCRWRPQWLWRRRTMMGQSAEVQRRYGRRLKR